MPFVDHSSRNPMGENMERRTSHGTHATSHPKSTGSVQRKSGDTDKSSETDKTTEQAPPTNSEGLPINRSTDPPTYPSPEPPGGVPADRPADNNERPAATNPAAPEPPQ